MLHDTQLARLLLRVERMLTSDLVPSVILIRVLLVAVSQHQLFIQLKGNCTDGQKIHTHKNLTRDKSQSQEPYLLLSLLIWLMTIHKQIASKNHVPYPHELEPFLLRSLSNKHSSVEAHLLLISKYVFVRPYTDYTDTWEPYFLWGCCDNMTFK